MMLAIARLWLTLLAWCHRRYPGLTWGLLVTQAIDVVAFVLVGLAMRAVVNASAQGLLVVAVLSAVGVAAASAADGVIGNTAYSLRVQLVESVGLADVDAEILSMVVGIEGLEHLEHSVFLDRVTMVRGQAWSIVDSAWGAVSSVFNALRLVAALALLGTVSPWLLLLLVFAAAPILFDQYGRRAVTRAETTTADLVRLQRHLFEVLTGAGSGKEVRTVGAGPELVARQRAAWDHVTGRRFRARMAAAAWALGGWAVFVLGFAAALAVAVHEAVSGHATHGDVVLVVTVAANLRQAVRSAVSRSTQTLGYARILRPYLWLRDYYARNSSSGGAGRAAPDRLSTGITFDGVGYTYPGTDRPAVDDITLHVPAGTVVAVVGEYGSGKTTLVKLLSKFYPTGRGRILVDGTPLGDIDTADWRRRTSAVFQDFGRYQTTLREAVGLGERAAMDDAECVRDALRAAGAEQLAALWPNGLETRLGAELGGVELSEGQWQKTALARACMRRHPILYLLDEPTASLDAPSEHAVFQRYLARARALARDTGAITVIVSHRFSTVAGADLILVLEGGRLVDAGRHEELVARAGSYAHMYTLAAASYQRT